VFSGSDPVFSVWRENNIGIFDMRKIMGAIVGCAIVLLVSPVQAEVTAKQLRDRASHAIQYEASLHPKTDVEHWLLVAEAADKMSDQWLDVMNRRFSNFCSTQKTSDQVLGLKKARAISVAANISLVHAALLNCQDALNPSPEPAAPKP
jgi:hypothetical protein